MYPATFFGLFPAFPRDDSVFVAMSFDRRFDSRWEQVILPAIGKLRRGDSPLAPFRVDLASASESVITEILDSISRCQFVVADITALDTLNGKPLRNANVLYEVGIAHSVRLPEEVIMFRSDEYELNFDIANVRVHQYSPDESAQEAQSNMVQIIQRSLRERDLKRSLAVRHAAQALDFHCWSLLIGHVVTGPFHHPPSRSMGDILGGNMRSNAIVRLLEIGALRGVMPRIEKDLLKSSEPPERLVTYEITPFGQALIDFAGEVLGMNDPIVQDLLEECVGGNESEQPESGES